MTKNRACVATGTSNSPEAILVEVPVPALTPDEWVVNVEKRLGNGYRLGQWERDRSCVAVGYEVFTVRRMRVVKSDARAGTIPEGCRAAIPYELLTYVERNPGLHDFTGVGCHGERRSYNDYFAGMVTEFLMYDGKKNRFESVVFHTAGFPLGTAILYVEL